VSYLSDERVTDISMWKEELLAEILADEVEMDNMKVLTDLQLVNWNYNTLFLW